MSVDSLLIQWEPTAAAIKWYFQSRLLLATKLLTVVFFLTLNEKHAIARRSWKRPRADKAHDDIIENVEQGISKPKQKTVGDCW